MTIHELHGIFSAYEMRTGHNEPTRKEATFKALSKNQLDNLDDEESIFISKLEKGIGNTKEGYP